MVILQAAGAAALAVAASAFVACSHGRHEVGTIEAILYVVLLLALGFVFLVFVDLMFDLGDIWRSIWKRNKRT